MKYASKHTAYIFYKNHICFFLCVLKNKHTAPTVYNMCGGIETLKHNVRTTLQFAYHGCKNLTHQDQKMSRKTHPNGCHC